MFVFGKIKTYIIATLALALPILYAMGRFRGAANEKNKVLEDDLKAAHKTTNFYKAMAEDAKDPTLSTRDGFLDRVRNGL